MISRSLGWARAIAAAAAVLVASCASGGEGGNRLNGDASVGPDGSILDRDADIDPGDDGGGIDPTPDGGGIDPTPDGSVAQDDAGTPDPDGGTDPGLLGPPYPIVLAHGFFGFDELLGIVDYWWGIPMALEGAGETQVYVTAVDPFNGSDVRGDELIAQIEDILAETGHAKVNLIGHSQGGLDARVVAHERPDLIASVTTVATPHFGTAVADFVETLSGPLLDELLGILADLLTNIYQQPSEADVLAALELFSESGIAAFNQTYTDSPGVRYFSVTGSSDRTRVDSGVCEVSNAPELVSKWYGNRDPIDPLLSLTEGILDDGDPLFNWGNMNPNDGLVTVESGKWGEFLGCIPADHLDEVGQLLGDNPGCTLLYGCNDFDHEQFYIDLAAFLRAEGY